MRGESASHRAPRAGRATSGFGPLHCGIRAPAARRVLDVALCDELTRRDGAWHALEGQFSRPAKLKIRTPDRGRHHIGYQDRPVARSRHQPRRDDHRQSDRVFTGRRVTACVHAAADLEAAVGGDALQRCGAPQRVFAQTECGQVAVTGELQAFTALTIDLIAHGGVVANQYLRPALVAVAGGRRGGVDDVGEQHGAEALARDRTRQS